MLHSLSHALMTEIALDCGYSSSALKERVYAEANLLNAAQIDRRGILIYTATTGSQGTLGGLVATSSRFATVLRSALERVVLCATIPFAQTMSRPRVLTTGRSMALRATAAY